MNPDIIVMAIYHGVNPGDIVTIYQDPVTERKPEGKARLVQRLDVDREGGMTLERWLVRFEGDARDFERSIRVGGGPS